MTQVLTFFVLLLSFAKTETSKYEAVLGSIRNALGGNQGKVFELGKSLDDAMSVIESAEPPKPFPIEFLTHEGLLDRHEINRASDEDLKRMKNDLSAYAVGDSAAIYEVPEGILVRIKDRIHFKEGSTEVEHLSVPVFESIIRLIREKNWTVFVEGYAAPGEKGRKGEDAYQLSSDRAMAVMRVLVRKGVHPGKVSPLFYGDSRSLSMNKEGVQIDRREERTVVFVIRKTDLKTEGHPVQ